MVCWGWWTGDLEFSSIPNSQLCWITLIRSSVSSSHLQPTVFRVTVMSLCGKQDKEIGTQYCFDSSGFGGLFHWVFYHLKEKRRPSWRTDRTDQDIGARILSSRSSAEDSFQPCVPRARVAVLPPVIGGPFTPAWIWLVWEDVVLRGGQGRAGGIQWAGLDCAGEATPRGEEHIGRGGGRDWLMVMWSQYTVALEPNRTEEDKRRRLGEIERNR